MTWGATYVAQWSWAAIWLSALAAGLTAILVLSVAAFTWDKISGPSSAQSGSRFRGLPMLPILGMTIGGLLFIGCAIWVLAGLNGSNQDILRALNRYVLPRHLSEQQIATIADYLQKHPPQKVKFSIIRNNEEASSYRVDIQQALLKGGWEIIGFDYPDFVQEGLSIHFQQTQASQQQQGTLKNPKPDTILLDALRAAKVRIDGSGGGSGIDTKENVLTIRIGHRRMDDGDLVKPAARARVGEENIAG